MAQIGGDWMERNIASHIRAGEVLIEAEQEKLMPDTHLISVLCDSVRMTREYLRFVENNIGKFRPTGRKGEGWERARKTSQNTRKI